MKKYLLSTLLLLPLVLASCNSGTASGTAPDYLRCQKISIHTGWEGYNAEPVKYVFAEYESSVSLKNTSTTGYGDENKTVYVYTPYLQYETYGLKDTATLNYSVNGTMQTTSAKLKNLIVEVHNSTELYYSTTIRTVKVKTDTFMSDKTYNQKSLDALEGKYYYVANLLVDQTVINGSGGSYQGFTSSSVETYTDLGAGAVTYIPYTASDTK